MILHIDIETFSPESIADCGLYRYAMHPDFKVLLFAYAYDDGPVDVLDLTKYELPEELIHDLLNPAVTKMAHNATFERVCLTMYLRSLGVIGEDDKLDPHQWWCTMAMASMCGLPASLAMVGEALGFEKQKMTEGKDLIKLFCTPREEGLVGGDSRVLPDEAPDKWSTFKDYCVRDVEVEQQIYRALSWIMDYIPEQEYEVYACDQHINDRGVLIDFELARQAAHMDATIKARLQKEAIDLTGLSNPNSVTQLKKWIGDRIGKELTALRKSDIEDLKGKTGDPIVDRMLQIRAEMGKSSCAKYYAMLGVVGPDDRARGLTQYYGTRTGRWAGRLLQLQNLPQNHIHQIDFARRCLKEGDYDTLELCFGNVPDVMSQLIRTALVARKGRTLAVCDFSAIEARVLAWMAGEEWVLDVFRGGGDIYCATASQMFKVPVEKHGRNAGLRQKGKIAVLALGYGGSVGALDAMGGQRMGLTEEEECEIVNMWRESNPHIVAFWKRVENAAKRAVILDQESTVGALRFFRHDKTLCIQLPSGRLICYQNMTQATNRFGRTSLQFTGMNQTTKKWEWIETHGGKLTENIIQAIARDCLAHVLIRLESCFIRTVFHVHDEVVCEVHDPMNLCTIQDIFANGPSWAEGLPLKGAGYVTPYYLKD